MVLHLLHTWVYNRFTTFECVCMARMLRTDEPNKEGEGITAKSWVRRTWAWGQLGSLALSLPQAKCRC